MTLEASSQVASEAWRQRALIAAAAIAVLAALIAAYVFGRQSSFPEVARSQDGTAVADCIDRYATKYGLDHDLPGAFEVCKNIVFAKLKAEEQVIRNSIFVFQQYENNVIMWMVVSITGGGVVLAGLQLLASYKLALLGRGSMGDPNAGVDMKKDSLAVKSSFVGVLILTLSFAFYLVFVLYVYQVKEDTHEPNITSPAQNTGVLINPSTN